MSDDKLQKSSAALGNQLQPVVEFVTGFMSSERKDWYLSAGHILQRVRGGRFLQTLLNEVNAYREKGRIKEDYFNTEQGQACLQELFDALDKDSPDEIRFKAMKAVLMTAATESKSTREDVLPQQLMGICRSLSSAEVLLLSAAFTWRAPDGTQSSVSWMHHALQHSALEIRELVTATERLLVEKSLFTRFAYKDESGFFPGKHGRLSELGFRVCEFIKAYEPEKQETPGVPPPERHW
jgi:hypothetical protein